MSDNDIEKEKKLVRKATKKTINDISDNNIAIEIKNLSKEFKVFKDKPLTLKEKILNLRSDEYTQFKVLKDINLTVKKGESIGLIGHNGCGKSTLLSLIAGIMYPNSGSVTVNGRLSCLIQLGAGFHPDFTGRENIYVNAAIFGMTRKEIDKNLDSIIEFSEIGKFIDNPIRTYSSGMYLKLAFSVATHINPEILLIDEILAVGDMNFQKKCFAKMEEFKRNRVTIILVSHSLNSVEKFCDRCIWLQDGIIKSDGGSKKVIEEYLSFMSGKQIKSNDEEKYTNEAEIIEFQIYDEKKESIIGRDIKSGIEIHPVINIKKSKENGRIKAEILFLTADEQLISVIDSGFIDLKKDEITKLNFDIKSIPLNSGVYTARAILKREDGIECCQNHELNITVKAEYENIGIFNLDFTCKKVD